MRKKEKIAIALVMFMAGIATFMSCDKEDNTVVVPQDEQSIELAKVSEVDLEKANDILVGFLASENEKNLKVGSYSFTPPSLGNLWGYANSSVPQGIWTGFYVDKSILEDEYDYYTNLRTISGKTHFLVAYRRGGSLYYVPDNIYNPAYYIYPGTTSQPIGFNTSTIAQVKRAIPDDADRVYFYIYGAETSTFRLNIYKRDVKLDVPWISQYRAGCGSLGFTNSFCGHTSLEMQTAYLNERQPTRLNVYPTTACGNTSKIPASVSDWLGNNYTGRYDNYCSYCGDGTPNPSYVAGAASGFYGFQDVEWWSTANYGSDVPDITLPAQGVMALLREQLSLGYPVMVQVHIQMDLSKGTHWMLLVGMDNDYVYLNDPGRSSQSNGKNARYTHATFANSYASDDCRKRTVVVHGGTLDR